jgi:hypothetical protein
MASTEIVSSTQPDLIFHQRTLVLAGSRLYACYHDGSNLSYKYSDDNGATWTGTTVISAGGGASPRVTAFYDSVNGRLNFVYAGGNSATSSLRLRAITSNVTSGTPGALTTETVIDSAGAALGIQRPYAFMSGGGTPRYWIIATKCNGVNVFETRAWFVAAGSSADTAGNWSTTNFTNLDSDSNANSEHMGVGVYWTVSGNPKVTLIFGDGEQGAGGTVQYKTCTFDPTAGTPTPGSFASITGMSSGTLDWFANGAPMTVAATADYLVFGRLDTADSQWDWVKTVDGTTWAALTNGTNLAMGRAQVALSGSDFYIMHTSSYGAYETTTQGLNYRKITASTSTVESSSTFSDTNGNPVAVPVDTGTTNLYGMYRGSTATPWTVRSDYVGIAPSGQTIRYSGFPKYLLAGRTTV